MRSLIVGEGEVGGALREIFEEAGFEVETKDVEEKEVKPGFDVMHVCLNYVKLGRENWLRIVRGYTEKYQPRLVDVCSTVEPGATALLGHSAVHSTTRGLHPHLAEGIRTIAKHVGGPRAQEVARYYSKAGVRCVTHRKAATTEVAHIAHLLDYGLQIASADMRNALCRRANVDYMESVVRYTDTHNAGFAAMDMPSKVRMSLTPPNGKIGGHCVVEAAKLARQYGFKHPLCDYLADFNGGRMIGGDNPEAVISLASAADFHKVKDAVQAEIEKAFAVRVPPKDGGIVAGEPSARLGGENSSCEHVIPLGSGANRIEVKFDPKELPKRDFSKQVAAAFSEFAESLREDQVDLDDSLGSCADRARKAAIGEAT